MPACSGPVQSWEHPDRICLGSVEDALGLGWGWAGGGLSSLWSSPWKNCTRNSLDPGCWAFTAQESASFLGGLFIHQVPESSPRALLNESLGTPGMSVYVFFSKNVLEMPSSLYAKLFINFGRLLCYLYRVNSLSIAYLVKICFFFSVRLVPALY